VLQEAHEDGADVIASLDTRISATTGVFKFHFPELRTEQFQSISECSSQETFCVCHLKDIDADPLYQHLIVTAERKFWRCVESGELPRLFGLEPPKPRIEAVRTVDMSASNSWAEFAGLFRDTRQAFLDHERSKTELKALMPEDAKEAIGWLKTHPLQNAIAQTESKLQNEANRGSGP
jgi:hypothetical protein